MSFGIGVVVIALSSLFVTWLMFGVNKDDSRKGRVLYWVKSTVFLWVGLFFWILYAEPNVGFMISLWGSLIFSSLANLMRSQWVFWIP